MSRAYKLHRPDSLGQGSLRRRCRVKMVRTEELFFFIAYNELHVRLSLANKGFEAISASSGGRFTTQSDSDGRETRALPTCGKYVRTKIARAIGGEDRRSLTSIMS